MGCGTSRPKAEGLVGTGLAGTGSYKRNQVEPAPSHDDVEEFESPLADAALADAALAQAAADAALAKARPMLSPGFKGPFGARDAAMGTGDDDDLDDLDTFELDEGGGVRKIDTKAGQMVNSTMKEAHRLADEAAGHIANIKTILDHDSLSTLPSLPDSSAAAQQDEDPKAAKQRAKLEAKEEKKRAKEEAKEEKKRAKEEAKRLKAEAKARKKKEKTGRGGGDGDDDDARTHRGGSEVVAQVALTFDYFDANKSGFLGYRELRNALRHYGLSDETIRDANSVLRRYDATPNGKLDLNEFAELVRDLVAPDDDSDDEQVRIDVGANLDDGKKKKKVRRPEHRQPQPFAHLASHRPACVLSANGRCQVHADCLECMLIASLRMDDAKCMLIASSAC